MQRCSYGIFEEASDLILNTFSKVGGEDKYGFSSCGNHGDYTLGLCQGDTIFLSDLWHCHEAA